MYLCICRYTCVSMCVCMCIYIACISANVHVCTCACAVIFLFSPVVTVRSLAPICSSPTSTLFSEHFFRQSHTARARHKKRKDCHGELLGTSWLLQEQLASLHVHAMLGRKGSVVVRQIFIPGMSCTGGISRFIFFFGWITSCGSASLKLCVWKAASPWSQSSLPGSQWSLQSTGKLGFCDGTQTQLTDIATNRLNWPSWPIQWKV